VRRRTAGGWTAGLGDDERAQIVEGTATRVYHLSATGSANRVGGMKSLTYVRSQQAPFSRSSRHVV